MKNDQLRSPLGIYPQAITSLATQSTGSESWRERESTRSPSGGSDVCTQLPRGDTMYAVEDVRTMRTIGTWRLFSEPERR